MTRAKRLLPALLVALAPFRTAAQAPAATRRAPLDIFVGSDRERYLRVLQTLGLVRPYPWSIRGFSPAELDRLRPESDAHPWAEYAEWSSPRPKSNARSGGAQQDVFPVQFNTWYNTTFPFGMNDGAVWTGRGLTAAAQGGGGVRQGPVSVVVAPLVFWAQNRSFPLAPAGTEGDPRFGDPDFGGVVDRPQRFGDRAYMRFDPGQSTARLDLFGVALGVSTANQWWGPMTEFPYILGNNAPGFTHVFFGSATPFNVGIGRLHARVMYGGLAQSAYTSITGAPTRRLAVGAIAVFSPRGAPGLELGVARFYHMVWPDSGIGSRELRRPFESFFKLSLPRDPRQGPENQLASLFGRWVLPGSGFEVYGEYGREDHNGNSRDLLQEPDHAATYGVGLQKAWLVRSGSVVALRGEIMNFEISSLGRHRPEGGFYIHTDTRQGHTHRGQLLGAGFAVGSGAGASIAVERYTTRGCESVTWSRLVRRDVGNAISASVRCANCPDVQHVLRAERVRRQGRIELRYGLAAVYELNRDFGRDATNWTPEVGLRWHP
jgi:capsule assembly protein Wzi